MSLASNAELEFFDGYVIAFSKNASEEIRAVARSTPDVDVSTAFEIDGR